MRKNPHVRIWGGLGTATALVYPTFSGQNSAETVKCCVWKELASSTRFGPATLGS